MRALLPQPVTIFTGHFGAGKSEIAIHAALALAAELDGRAPVHLVDLDVVKPYFRSRLVRAALAPRGVRVVAPAGELATSDLPILLPEVRALAASSPGPVLLDDGGDDFGARALAAIADVLRWAGGFDLLYVVNACRPRTGDAPAARVLLDRIEATAGLRATGIVANSHLMEETTVATVLDGLAVAHQVAAATGLPLRLLAAPEAVAEAVAASLQAGAPPLVPIRRQLLAPFRRGRRAVMAT